MELVTIGEAAQVLALNTSALRYYEDRGLVTPERRGGKRMYSREQLRRLAFIQLMQRLGIAMTFNHRTRVHAIELIAGEDQHFMTFFSIDVAEVLADRVGRARRTQ